MAIELRIKPSYNTLMVKQSKKKMVQITKPWVIVGVASLALNAILVVAVLSGAILHSSGAMDYAIINKGVDTLCSDRFRNISMTDRLNQNMSADEQKTRMAYLDYQCARNGAETYYEQSFKDYTQSLGITTE